MDNQFVDRDKRIKAITEKQNESNKRVLAKHPELETYKREVELKSQGKTNDGIQEALCAENEKYRICSDIVKSNPEMYLTKENGPELVAAEMEKRLKAKSVSAEPTELEKLKGELEAKDAEIARLKGLDETVTSTREKERKSQEKKTEFEIQQEALAKRAGISPDRLKAMKARRASISGADSG
jgi:hypothetical protein